MANEYKTLILQVTSELGQKKFIKYRKVKSLKKLFIYLEKRGFKIHFVNEYDPKTKNKIASYPYSN